MDFNYSIGLNQTKYLEVHLVGNNIINTNIPKKKTFYNKQARKQESKQK